MKETYYRPKSGKTLVRQKRMTKKLWPTEAHVIVKDYMKIKAGKHKYFREVKDLIKERKVSRNVPSKLLTKFHMQWKELHPKEEVNYKVNVFLERSKLCKHRSLPEYEEYESFVKQYSRWGYQSYRAECEQKWKKAEIKKWMYYYYKPGMKDRTKSVAPAKKKNKRRLTAKERYGELYKEYDFVIHLDGKSMEDQERVRKNGFIRDEAKRLTLWVEAMSWTIVGIWIEKSHCKSNALLIIQEICEHIESSFFVTKRICFITDAGSEYLINKDLRGLEITDKEVSKIATYLREKWHGRRITRRPEDNSFVENKNDYIERTCLDSYEIEDCDQHGFACLLDKFLQRNNQFLRGVKKSFRGGITPEENIASRFWKIVASRRICWLHTKYIEKLYGLSGRYKKFTISKLLEKIRFNVKTLSRRSENAVFYDENAMHPKSLDSSSCVNFSWFQGGYWYIVGNSLARTCFYLFFTACDFKT